MVRAPWHPQGELDLKSRGKGVPSLKNGLHMLRKLRFRVGRGFIPGINVMQSSWASAPELCFSFYTELIRSLFRPGIFQTSAKAHDQVQLFPTKEPTPALPTFFSPISVVFTGSLLGSPRPSVNPLPCKLPVHSQRSCWTIEETHYTMRTWLWACSHLHLH